jgi:hypothetical protein
VQVGCGKAEDMEAGIHEGILPSQIGHQAILVVLTVELDKEPDV